MNRQIYYLWSQTWLVIFGCVLWSNARMVIGERSIFRYEDSRGRIIFTDRERRGPQYKLIWSTTLRRLDASFERDPHRPLVDSNKRRDRRRRWRGRAKLSPLIARIAQQTNVNVNLLHAVVQAESGYNPNARSPAGAKGLMQLMPATAKRYGVRDIMDPEQNLRGGAEYLQDLLKLFNNNMQLALAAYNAGEGTVLRYGKQIPPYPETQEYVRRVIANFKREQG